MTPTRWKQQGYWARINRAIDHIDAQPACEEAFDQLTEAAATAYPSLHLRRGFEVMLDDPAPDLSDPRLRMAGTSFVLVEWPERAKGHLEAPDVEISMVADRTMRSSIPVNRLRQQCAAVVKRITADEPLPLARVRPRSSCRRLRWRRRTRRGPRVVSPPR